MDSLSDLGKIWCFGAIYRCDRLMVEVCTLRLKNLVTLGKEENKYE